MSPAGHRASVVTPHGTGAIAVIRLIGPDPEAFLRGVWECGAEESLTDGRLRYGRLMDGEETLDDVLLSVESIGDHQRAVEISCHGGVYIVQRILGLLEKRGARIATDKLEELQVWPAGNRIEAEALEALAHVKTQRAAKYAALLRTELPPTLERHLMHRGPDGAHGTPWIRELMEGFAAASALLRGVSVCLVGPPNGGKSTLFNFLLGRQAVVTSPIAGTTRDWVAETVELEGLAVELVDTAGRRHTECELERQAIEVGNFPLARSDLALLVLDQSEPFPQEAVDCVRHARQLWVVANKSDLAKCWMQEDLVRLEQSLGTTAKFIAARTGEGCELLKRAIVKHFGLLDPTSPALAFFTERQRDLAARAWDRKETGSEFFLSLLGMDLAEAVRKGL